MARTIHGGAGPLLTLLLAIGGAACAAPAAAQVIEIANDGSVGIVAPAPDGIETVGAMPAAGAEPADAAAADDAVPDVPPAAFTPVGASAVPVPYRQAVTAAAERARISPDLLAALVWQESRWKPDAVSNKGARGLAQLMPATASALAVDPRDPAANLNGGAAYLRRMLDLFDGDIERALAAYNAGPARVIRAGGVPAIAETRAYVTTILDRLGRSDAARAGETAR